MSLVAIMEELGPSLSVDACAVGCCPAAPGGALCTLVPLSGASVRRDLHGPAGRGAGQHTASSAPSSSSASKSTYGPSVCGWRRASSPRETRRFFVSESASKVPLSRIWQHQYKLRLTGDGVLHAPKFLQPAASRIFTTGKSIVILKHLGRFNDGMRKRGAVDEPRLDLETVCPPGLETGSFHRALRRCLRPLDPEQASPGVQNAPDDALPVLRAVVGAGRTAVRVSDDGWRSRGRVCAARL